MKKIILSLAIAIFLISGISYASFPVKKEDSKIETISTSKEENSISKTEKSFIKHTFLARLKIVKGWFPHV